MADDGQGSAQAPVSGSGRNGSPAQIARGSAFRRVFDPEVHGDNSAPFPFAWVDPRKTNLDYGAVLARVSNRF
jgi:hypothetical protein